MRTEVTIQAVLEAAAANPGQSRARLAATLGGRRAVTLKRIAQALAEGLVHEDLAQVKSRNGQRSVMGIYPGPATPEPDEHLMGPQAYLRDLREGARLPAQLLATQFGVSVNLIYHWETDRQVMPAWAARRLPGALEAASAAHQAGGDRTLRRHRARSQAVLRLIRDEPGQTVTELAEQMETSRADVQRRVAPLLEADQVHAGRPAKRVGSRDRGLYPGPPPGESATAADVAGLVNAVRSAGWSGRRIAGLLGVSPSTWSFAAAGRPMPAYVSAALVESTRRQVLADASRLEDDLVAKVAAAHPAGISHEHLVRDTFGRSQAVLDAFERALSAGRFHYAPTPVVTSSGSRRGVTRHVELLHPGPASERSTMTGEQLEQLRRSRHITRAALAASVGVSAGSVTMWETGKRPIPQPRAVQFVEHLEPMPAHAEPLADRNAAPVSDEDLEHQVRGYVGEHPLATAAVIARNLRGATTQRRLRVIAGMVTAGDLVAQPTIVRRSDGQTRPATGLTLNQG